MAFDAYDPCPCGSGKKFKWCCQPIHVQIDRAFQQEAQGQHDAALRIMDEVLAENPGNPEAYGRKAQLLYQHQRAEEAENVLQKAFDINPNYPFGYLLRGMFRQEEGEAAGALLLFRKAADLYDAEAHDHLGHIYSLIAENEMKMNRPLAGRAALKLSLHHSPGNEELHKAFESVFGPESRLPEVARREYAFQPPHVAAGDTWTKALATDGTAKLSDAARAFEQLTQDNAEDAPAWYNLGLAHAWLGDNRGALEALDRYVSLEPDASKAAAAWALAEVLRVGRGMEEFSDHIEHSALFQVRDPNAFSEMLNAWQHEQRFLIFQVNQEHGIISGFVLEKRKPALTPELAATQIAPLGAYVLILGDHLRVWHTDAAALAQIRDELQQRCGAALSVPRLEQSVANFTDMLAETFFFPQQHMEPAEAEKRIGEFVQRWFEETWIHRPLKSLNQIPPVDAAGQPTLRKKLLGLIQFLHDAAIQTPAKGYDFDRLRRKLGLVAAAPEADVAELDITTLGAAELASLQPDSLSDARLEQAFQTALKLDARDLAGHFAQTLVARPPHADHPRDRYACFTHLSQLSVAEGRPDAALRLLVDGEQFDADHNEGKRRNDYQLRRGQLHAKHGETEQAHDVFARLIERVPAELKYRGSAAEAMLSAKQPDHALKFAEPGLAKAREKNDRDSEQYLLELIDAAKRMKG